MSRSEKRRRDIASAALRLAVSEGVASVSMARLADMTGLSRPAVYQYFPSRDHVLGELMLNDIADLANNLDRLVNQLDDPLEQVRVWLHYCLAYLASEEHQVILSIGREQVPKVQLGEIGVLHGMFMTSLLTPLTRLGAPSPETLVNLVYGAVDAAAKRVVDGADLSTEAHYLERFALAGLDSAMREGLVNEAVEHKPNYRDNRHN